MERNKSDDDTGALQSEAGMVERGGETTAAATGPAEIGAATGAQDDDQSAGNTPPVGAGTRVKVEGEQDS